MLSASNSIQADYVAPVGKWGTAPLAPSGDLGPRLWTSASIAAIPGLKPSSLSRRSYSTSPCVLRLVTGCGPRYHASWCAPSPLEEKIDTLEQVLAEGLQAGDSADEICASAEAFLLGKQVPKIKPGAD